MTEFLEVLAADLADIGKLHPFFEKPFVKGEYPVVDQMQRSVDEVVGRSQAVFIAGVDQREIFMIIRKDTPKVKRRRINRDVSPLLG